MNVVLWVIVPKEQQSCLTGLLNKYILKMTVQVRAASWMTKINAEQESAS